MDNLNLEQNFAPIIIDKDTQCTALTKSDFQRLHNYLNNLNAEIKNLAELDGFLAVVAINPKAYYEELICAIIYDVDFEKGEARKIFDTKGQYDDFVDLISRRILFLFEAITQEKLDNMLLFNITDTTNVSTYWIRGVTRALIIFDEDFRHFDPESFIDTVVLLTLMSYPENIETEEEREILIAVEKMADFTELTIDYLYQLNEDIGTYLTHKPETIKNIPKPKRNELCDCGSGKKYKKCCG